MFEMLTKYLDVLKDGDYGEVIPRKELDDGTVVNNVIKYSKSIKNFEQSMNIFLKEYPVFKKSDCLIVLKENGIDLNNPLLFKNKLQEYDSRVVFNILLAIIQKEQFCEGEMMCALNEGKIQECLKVLREFDKKYNSETIKEISISSNFVFMKLNDYWYKDLLRISEHWVSYKRNDFMTGLIRSEWSYKSSKENFYWKQLTETAIKTFNWCNSGINITDNGSFNLRITFKNGNHWDLELASNFAFNKLDELAFIIKKIIPSEETEYPDVLNVIPLFLRNHELTKKNLKELKKNEICAFMYAELGAMGSPGEICIIDTNGNKFSTGGIFSSDVCDINLEDIIEKYFNGIEIWSGLGAPNICNCTINKRPWIYENLGMGNHLFMRKDFWEEHGARIMDPKYADRYIKWKKLIKE